jgi:hypothetical protein
VTATATSFSPVGIGESVLAWWGGDCDSMVFRVEVVRTFDSDAARWLPVLVQRALIHTLLRTHLARRHEIAVFRVTEVTRGLSRHVIEIGFDDLADARHHAKRYTDKIEAGGRFFAG